MHLFMNIPNHHSLICILKASFEFQVWLLYTELHWSRLDQYNYLYTIPGQYSWKLEIAEVHTAAPVISTSMPMTATWHGCHLINVPWNPHVQCRLWALHLSWRQGFWLLQHRGEEASGSRPVWRSLSKWRSG